MNETQRAAALRLAEALEADCMIVGYEEVPALLRELAAEPVPEPVAVTTKVHLAAMQNGYTRSVVARDPKFAAIGAMQDNDVPLYAAPQQRKPLTNVQITNLAEQCGYDGAVPTVRLAFQGFRLDDFARAIEKAITGEQK